MIKYAPIKVAACKNDAPVGYNRGGNNYTFPDINAAYKYFQERQCYEFDCGCKFDIKEVVG